jgi:hypothetical protein
MPAGDPVSAKLDQVLNQLNASQGMPGAAKPAGGAGKKGGGEMQYNIILKLLARICDALQIPVSLEELLTQEQQIAAFQAQGAAGGPVPAAAPPAAAAPAGELMGNIAPPAPVAPLTSVLPAGAAGPPPGTKSSGYEGQMVTPAMLHSPSGTGQPDLLRVLRGELT